MKLITTNAGLSAQLSRLVGNYPNIAFAVAWASYNTPIMRRLLAVRERIKKGVIGTHFYQTAPEVLEAFMGSHAVRFRMQPNGVFHPKLYVFWDATRWEAIVGSANLTSGALITNSEVVVMFSGHSVTTEPLAADMLACIDDYWRKAEVATNSTVEAYRSVWTRQQPVLRRLGGQYGMAVPRKAPVGSSVLSMRWSQFVDKVQLDSYHGFAERCALLRAVGSAFETHADFASMPHDVRKIIAGLPASDPRWGWFGSMKGAGRFQRAVKNNSTHLSRALALLPALGRVTQAQYDAFIAEYVLAFPNGGHGLASASRLLAMKRPDQFLCIDSKNRTALCDDFGIPATTMNYERYWTEIIERVLDSPWWNAERPKTPEESMVWDGRVAMLDAIFYRE